MYEITSRVDDKTVSYRVTFGGGFAFEQYTGFDPETKKFVYLKWKRGEKAPKPVSKIWDHQTGKTVSLYKFPGAKNLLSIIPSVKEMKFCPVTGNKEFEVIPRIAID